MNIIIYINENLINPLYFYLIIISAINVTQNGSIKVKSQPGKQFLISWIVTITDYYGSLSDLVAVYLGDSELPQDNTNNPEGLPPIGANLPFLSKVGNVFTFSKSFIAYNYEAMFHPRFTVSTLSNNKKFGQIIVGEVDITCSDGIYCNGVERYIQNKCTPSPVLPCQIMTKDGKIDKCRSYQCNETLQRCEKIPIGGLISNGGKCETCLAEACSPNCSKTTLFAEMMVAEAHAELVAKIL